MDEKRKHQFDVIEEADKHTYSWAKQNMINLHNIEVIVPFVETDFDLHILFFYKTNKELSQYNSDNTSKS